MYDAYFVFIVLSLCFSTGSPSTIYEQHYTLTFALLRDSSDLHIYKDLYGENNDVSVTYENKAI